MSTTTVERRYHFEAAHWLPGVPETHKCHRIHGHNYEFSVEVGGPIDERGFIIDFWELDAIVQPLIDRVDHRLLNDIEGLQNPTAELIAAWFAVHVNGKLVTTHAHACVLSVRVWETKDCWATYSVK